MKKLDAFQLKIIALVVMLMDHMYFAFPLVFPLWFHALSRFVAPLFAFLMVEGLFHTRNKLKYNLRLFGWALFMQAGNYVLNGIVGVKHVQVHNNIFMTLALGLAILNIFELSKKFKGTKKAGLIVLGIILIPLGVFVEGGISLLPFIMITYLFREQRTKALIGYLILTAILFFFFSLNVYPTIQETISGLMYNSDFLFILVIPFMYLYNGKRGVSNKFSKYLFYVFYPLHLWVLAILEYVLK